MGMSARSRGSRGVARSSGACWGVVVEKNAVGVHGIASNYVTCAIWSRRSVSRVRGSDQTAEGKQGSTVACSKEYGGGSVSPSRSLLSSFGQLLPLLSLSFEPNKRATRARLERWYTGVEVGHLPLPEFNQESIKNKLPTSVPKQGSESSVKNRLKNLLREIGRAHV